MNKEQLQSLLHEDYKTENWKKISEFVFPNVQFLNKPQDIPVNNAIVKSFKQLGNVKLNDGKNLAMFEVTVAENVNIAHNRVALRGLVKDYIDQERNHGVLVIYEQGKDDYRFTFTAKSTEFDNEKLDFVNRETDSKRFTYVLGKNESCKTPAERFFSLAQNKDKADIKAVEDAFSVEKLSKQFFKEYKEHYLKFVNYIISENGYRTAIFKENEKDIRNFVKLLLGRLVFIQFVQKKKWMGVPADNTGWDSGDPKFLYNSFKDFKNKKLFYSQFLEPLFYDALSKNERKNDVFNVTGTKIPFLNGGLFEKSNIDTSMLCFPAEYFSELFEFFDKYNFTINEYDPIEHEIGIDPEMLGSIFENLLEDNKDKGAFYTPKEIVHYMCQESLKEYLKTYLQEKKLWKENEELEAGLDDFVKKKEAAGVIDYDEQLAIALRDVKICDPAIGSGAFPMGLLNEIYQCVYVLHYVSPDVVGDVWNMGDEWQPDVVKKNIIQNSIYGVDIEKGAVDIARLRFWLSLIIDEPEPHALPNLDYKIVVGNSLLSKYGDEVIDIDWSLNYMSQGLFAAEIAKEKESLLKNLSKKQIEFFNQNSNKTKLSLEIRNLKIDLIINQLQLMIDKQNIQKEPIAIDYKDKSKFAKAKELFYQTKKWKKIIIQLKDLQTKPEKPLDFFDWKLDFPEIMNENVVRKTGFDIVIGNPPYVRQERIDVEFKQKLILRFSKISNGTADLYVYFFGIGLEIIKHKGILCYITLNKYLKTKYGIELRNLLAKEYDVDTIIDFFELPIFEAAADTCITKVIANFENRITKYFPIKTLDGLNLFKLSSHRFQKVLKDETEWKFVDDGQESIIEKFGRNTVSLKDYTNDKLFYGVKTGANHVFIIDQTTYDQIISKCDDSKKYIHPYLEPTKFDSWNFENTQKYIIGTFPSRKVDLSNAPALLNYLSKYRSELEPKPKNYSGAWKGRKTGNYKWYETQDNIQYWELFFKPKIVFIHTAKRHYFFQDNYGYFINNSCYFISSNSDFLFCFLNSKLFEWYKKIKFVAYGDADGSGRSKLDYNKMITVPIKIISKTSELTFSKLIEDIRKNKLESLDTIYLESHIDNLLYRIYDLSYNEVKIIDPNFSLTKEEYENIKID